MGYRRKSKEAAIFESVTSLAALGLLFWFLSPAFRSIVQFLLLLAAIVALLALAVWLLVKLINREDHSADFQSSTNNPYPIYEAIPKQNPEVIVKEIKIVREKPQLTISEKLRKIDWFQFEKLVELIYRHRGFTVRRLGGANADGGVDLIVESTTAKFVVQCKHWRKWTVGVRHIREFLGTLTDCKIAKGIFITLVGYSGDAKQLADRHGIQILNESDLIKMLEESGLKHSQEISRLFSDERKFCPRCEKEMVLRTARVKGNQFWGCSSYPRCRFVLNLEA